jgi:hypothetical protein
MPTSETPRPDPDALLARVKDDELRARRGRLRIFFGATAGVGKSYAMLEAARRQRADGIDIVVGYVELHGRPETEALLDGLEILPPMRLEHRGIALTEFDLDGALARKPALLVVDELAHSNHPGARHAKRWQDVEELLAAGIDVYTTVNVQHLDSLHDVVAQITGVDVRETVPDRVFAGADEVELVDLPPDELHERLAESAPWWLPGPVETRLFERIIEGVSSTLQAMVDDHEHPLRVSLLERVDELAVQLETSPELRARGEALKQQILDQPELQQWLGSLWRDLKQRLRTEAETPGSQLHEWLADRIMEAGRRLAEDPELAAALEAAVTRGIAYMAERFQGEVSALVRTTIERWDATETAFRLELLLGPDLQFIRINGTVVGAMAGLALHAIAQALG